ncbi:MAG: hypothetical protein ACJ75G_05350 [Gaiellaceae bacterium]
MSASNAAAATTASKVILAFTDCPFARLTEQPGRVTRVVNDASDVATYSYEGRRRTVNSRRLGNCGPDGVAIADYRIICVVRRADGHPRAVGYSENGNGVMYDDLWTIEQAREAIQQGHRLYIVNAETGTTADLELHGDGFRTTSADYGLDDLPPCG